MSIKKISFGSTYFVVSDIERSIDFYTKLVGKPPTNTEIHNGQLRWADWGEDAKFALIASFVFEPNKIVYGNNAVINLVSENLEESYELAKSLGAKIIEEVNVVHAQPYLYKCFLIQDIDGNLIEIAYYQ